MLKLKTAMIICLNFTFPGNVSFLGNSQICPAWVACSSGPRFWSSLLKLSSDNSDSLSFAEVSCTPFWIWEIKIEILQHKVKVNFVKTSKSLNKVTKTKFMKSCSKLEKLPFHKIVFHETKSCQKVAEQLVETLTDDVTQQQNMFFRTIQSTFDV